MLRSREAIVKPATYQATADERGFTHGGWRYARRGGGGSGHPGSSAASASRGTASCCDAASRWRPASSKCSKPDCRMRRQCYGGGGPHVRWPALVAARTQVAVLLILLVRGLMAARILAQRRTSARTIRRRAQRKNRKVPAVSCQATVCRKSRVTCLLCICIIGARAGAKNLLVEITTARNLPGHSNSKCELAALRLTVTLVNQRRALGRSRHSASAANKPSRVAATEQSIGIILTRSNSSSLRNSEYRND